VPSALDRDDRLRAADAAREAGELARVAEALQVQEHDLGRGVGGPVLEEVVAADVGPVAGRHEGRQPEVAAAGTFEERHPERSGLGEEPHPPADGDHRCQAGVEPHLGVGVDHAQAVGADDAHAGGPGRGDQLPLGDPPLRAGLAEPAGDHHQSLDPLAPACLDDAGHLVGRHGDHGEVDVIGDRLDVGVGRDPPDVPRAGVHRVDRA
jgi:hypothetical protein